MDQTQMAQQGLVLFLTLFVMMVGLIFTVIPPIPGTLVIWGAAIGYGLLLGWESLGWITFIILTIFMLLGIIGDVAGGQFGAKVGGASCQAVAVGTVAGFVAGLVGSLIGTPIVGCLVGLAATLGGILMVEKVRYGTWKTAMKSTSGYLAGHVLGIVAKVAAGLLMIGIFWLRVYLWR
jgi:uncharacterized protein YqgC (DUF456 family)